MSKNKAFSLWKWILILGAVGLLVGGAWYFYNRGAPEIQYQTAKVTRGELTQTVTATGTLNPVVNVQVGSQISGRISKLYVDFNSTVTSNQIIAEIDPSTYKANMQRAEADLASAMAGLELAQVEARRAGELFTNNLISASDHDTAIASLHQAEATAQIRRAALSSTGVDLSRCTIYSPVDGVVISRNVDVGQTVAASLSAPVLFQIANDLGKMQIDANVSEADVGGVEERQSVNFTVDAFPTRTFSGKVMQVRNSPITVQNVVSYDTVIEVSNPDLKLKPGMTANASIITAQRFDVLKIPNAALRFRPPEGTAGGKTNVTSAAASPVGGQSGMGRRSGEGGRGGGDGAGGHQRGERRSARTIYLLKDGKPQPVPIKTGITDGLFTEVTEGLNENNEIIISATSKQASATPPPPTASPFGGPMRRF
jgi:HlyD family secretion protein